MVARNPASLDELHPAEIAAVTLNAERQAIMVAACLRALDGRLKQEGLPKGAAGLPMGFHLELGAICQLKLWELEGLRDFLPSDVPTAAEASAELHRRVMEAPQQFKELTSAWLSYRVMVVWLERFAWAAPNLLQADVVLGEVDEDVLVEALARLLWNHRHDAAVQVQHSE